MIRQIMTGLAAVVGLAVWVGQPVQAKEWPSGYDPQSGLTWEQDFTYDPARNPYGSSPGAYNRPDFFFRGGRDFAPPGAYASVSPNYYYGYPLASYVPRSDYSYGALAPRPDNIARIRLIVPNGAQVWFDNQLTRQSGTMRNFESPALTPDRTFHYDVKVQWRDVNGKEMTQTRRVEVSANRNVTVDFTRPGNGS